jgi:membrane protein implicated in regulation of membrane protease activity
MVGSELDQPSVRFEPLRPVSRGRLIAAFVLGPILWLLALIGVALAFHYSWAIALGVAVAAVSFLVSLLVLATVYSRRRRQERRYAHRG